MKRPPKDPADRAVEGVNGIIVRLHDLADGLRKRADVLDERHRYSAAHIARSRANSIDREAAALEEVERLAAAEEEKK